MPTPAKRLAQVAPDSSMAMMPLPGATMAKAVSASCSMLMGRPAGSGGKPSIIDAGSALRPANGTENQTLADHAPLISIPVGMYAVTRPHPRRIGAQPVAYGLAGSLPAFVVYGAVRRIRNRAANA